MKLKLTDTHNLVYGENLSSSEEVYAEINKQLEGYKFKKEKLNNLIFGKNLIRINYGSSHHAFYVEDMEDSENFFKEFGVEEQNFFLNKEEINADNEIRSLEDVKNLEELFEGYQESKAPDCPPEHFFLNVIGTENLAKLIESLTFRQHDLEFVIKTDSFQSFKEGSDRSYIVEIADNRDGKRFILEDETSW